MDLTTDIVLLFDVIIAIVIFIICVSFCYFKYKQRKRIKTKLENIRISVEGTVIGVERVPLDRFEDENQTIVNSFCYEENKENVCVYVVRIDEPKDVIKSKTLGNIIDKVGSKEYNEISRYSHFRGSETNEHVYVQISSDEYKSFDQAFKVILDVCPLVNAPGTQVEYIKGENNL